MKIGKLMSLLHDDSSLSSREIEVKTKVISLQTQMHQIEMSSTPKKDNISLKGFLNTKSLPQHWFEN